MVSLRVLKNKDIVQAIRLSRAERWNQTTGDWALLTGNEENVCLAALVGENIIGTATAMIYDHMVAWIGMVLVNRDFRGQGVGKNLFSTLFEKLNPDLSVKLDATPAGQPLYKEFGFKDEYLIYRMTCPSVSVKSISPERKSYLEQVGPNNIGEIVDYDRQVFGATRRQLIHYLVENDPENAWMTRQGTNISGLALGRNGTYFHQIGPVLASSTQEAISLITKSLKGLEGNPVVVDILEDKKELIDWLKTLGFSSQRYFVRMYRTMNPFPGIPGNQYLIAGPEFG
jgi:predicted GNAT family N-acyltransferase